MTLGRSLLLVGALACLSAGCASKAPSSMASSKGSKKDTNVPSEGDSRSGGSSSSTTPPPGGADTTTNAPSSPVSPASPKLDSIDPTSAPADPAEGSQVDVTLSGSQFDAAATVSVGDQNVKPTSQSASKIVVRLPAASLGKTGSVPIKVLNPPKAGGPSNALAFTVTSAVAKIALASIDPTTAEAGGTSTVMLAVSGSGFTASSKVRFNGQDVKTTFGSASSLTASVPSTMLKIPGKVSVTVHDTAGTDVSTPKTFTITKATATNTCNYACADYGYSNGQCYQDWTCGNDGCLVQQACSTASTCQYKCADYRYTAGQCYQDWTCGNDGCLTQKACAGGSGSVACDYSCVDYGYADNQCYAGWCCDPTTECLVDESVFYGP